MRKIISFLCVLSLLSALFAPFSLFGDETAPAPAIWSGKTAGGFAGGDGSTNDPFRVESAEQFAYFAKEVNGGRSFANKTVLLACDIYLNDEIFSFNADTGLVKVSGGENFAYLSLGIRGDDSGENEIFDSMHIPGGCWLKSDTLQAEPNGQSSVISDCYRGTVHAFSPINGFDGIFDGGGHCVSGLYIDGREDDPVGLFGKGNGSIHNLRLENSLIYGAGGACGIACDMQLLENCHSAAFVYGSKAGGLGLDGKADFCEFNGIVSGQEAGGVLYEGEAENCRNNGTVYGLFAGGILYNGTAYLCENSGTVKAFSYSSDNKLRAGAAGGIAYTGNISHCKNSAAVNAYSQVGGIAATAISRDTSIRYCQNRGNVSGYYYVGGIVGYGTAENCSNYAPVYGNYHHIGGIAGMGNATLCFNTGTVEGTLIVGGIIGGNDSDNKFAILQCYNLGTVNASNEAGGIVGSGDSMLVTDCYNGSEVNTITSVAGGIAGDGKDLTLIRCHNMGNIRGRFHMGGVIGKQEANCSIQQCYFMQDCVTSPATTQPIGIGSYPIEDLPDPYTKAVNYKLIKYDFDFDFENTWQMGSDNNPFPILQDLHHGDHIFVWKVEPAYLRTKADCHSAATYYPVCACGMIDTAYETAGDVAHSLGDLQFDDDYHFRLCSLCKEACQRAPHQFAKGITVEKENEHFVVYKCTDCGKELSLPLASYETDLPTLTVILYIAAGGVVGALGVFSFLSLRTRAKKQKKTKDFV